MRCIRVACVFLATLLGLAAMAAGQDIAPPTPVKFTLHSTILNEDRTIWVRLPRGYQQGKNPYPVLYQTDAPGHINETGNSIDFLVDNGRMPALILVGIANTDRTRDLTPTHDDSKGPDGKEQSPTSGGADRFLDFMQKELMPEIERRYRTAPYKIFAGHSLGGLLAIHALVSRPDIFDAYIAVSPSLWWTKQSTLHQAEQFFAAHASLHKTLFFSLGNEGSQMSDPFDQLRQDLSAKTPKDFRWGWERYKDEDHGSTVLRAHYAGLRTVFADWQMPRDPKDGSFAGGLAGLEKHYRDLSQRFGYTIPLPENEVNQLGYQLMAQKKLDDAIAVFRRNVELYPGSANTYDSLGEGLEAASKYDEATTQFQKAVALGVKMGDPNTEQYRGHIERVAKTTGKASPAVVAVSAPVATAAPPSPPPTLAAAVDREITDVEKQILDVAEAMPADKFGFTPAGLNLTGSDYKGVRTFAQEMKHVAASNYAIWAPLTGETFPSDFLGGNGPENLRSKAEIVQFLKDSFALGHKASATLTPENMLENPGKSRSTRLRLAVFAVEHAYDHYGQMVEYLRMNGIVPPASRNSQ